MAFATRCPECDAKLAFDEAPDADEAIECPRCGHMFDAAGVKAEKPKKKPQANREGGDAPRKKKKKKRGAAGKVDPKAPKKRRIKQRKSNPFLLWMMAIGALVVAPAVGWVFFKLFFSVGKIGALMAYVPPDCNLMRGVDITRLAKYPGYKDQLATAMKGPFEECATAFTAAAGEPAEDKEKGPYIDYAMCAKNKRSGTGGTMYVFQTRIPYDPKKIFVTGLGGSEQQMDGTTYYKLPATQPGVLANAMVYCPTEKIICLIANEENSSGMLKASLSAMVTPKETSMMAKLGATGNKVSRANIWFLLRAEGDLAGRIQSDIGDPIKTSLNTLSQKVNTSKMFGVYMYFGTSVKYGVAMQCDSREAAEGIVKSMKEGVMGKQDDSEIPRDLRSAFPPANPNNKDFVEFLSTLIYNSKGDCAFLEAKMALEKSSIMLTYFNKPDMFDTAPAAPGAGLRRP